MVRIKAVMAGLALAAGSMAAVSGRVTDTSGNVGIAGAIVRLETLGQADTTDGDGYFTILVGSTTINRHAGRVSMPAVAASIEGGVLRVTAQERCAIEIAGYDLRGRAISSVRQTVDAGNHSLALAHTAAAVCLYEVTIGGNRLVLKGNSIGGAFSQGAGSASDFLSTTSGHPKQVASAARINDVIAATRAGYLNYRVAAYSYDMTGIQIKMIASAGTVADADGNVYQTVRIGNQVWTAENLRTTKYNDGSPIPFDTSIDAWRNPTPRYCFYESTTNADSINRYGALYNWYVIGPANPKKVAPPGWHVPSEAEWDTLRNYLIAKGYNWDGTATGDKIAKSLAAQTDWHTYPTGGTIGCDLTYNNTSGFSALPGGRGYGAGFQYRGCNGYWWSTTKPFAWSGSACRLRHFEENMELSSSDLDEGLSVRLLRD